MRQLSRCRYGSVRTGGEFQEPAWSNVSGRGTLYFCGGSRRQEQHGSSRLVPQPGIRQGQSLATDVSPGVALGGVPRAWWYPIIPDHVNLQGGSLVWVNSSMISGVLVQTVFEAPSIEFFGAVSTDAWRASWVKHKRQSKDRGDSHWRHPSLGRMEASQFKERGKSKLQLWSSTFKTACYCLESLSPSKWAFFNQGGEGQRPDYGEFKSSAP